MKILFIGGTGTISMAISRKVLAEGDELYLLNRGNRNAELPEGAISLVADINKEEEKVAKMIEGMHFDAVADFIAFRADQIERDFRLFNGKTDQYLSLSSASAYQKPVGNYFINEGTPLANPYWKYSREKIECEDLMMKHYREDGFPVTIVRPSHTYDERRVPMGVESPKMGSWPIIDRMLRGKPVIIHGDGTSLWTMTFNRDFAEGFYGLLGNVRAIGEAVQITCEETLTWNQIYEATAKALGVKLNPYYVSTDFLIAVGAPGSMDGIIGDKANSVVFDTTKIKTLVPGYAPKYNFSEGVRIAIDYIMKHPELQTPDPEYDEWCDRVIETLENAKKAFKK